MVKWANQSIGVYFGHNKVLPTSFCICKQSLGYVPKEFEVSSVVIRLIQPNFEKAKKPSSTFNNCPKLVFMWKLLSNFWTVDSAKLLCKLDRFRFFIGLLTREFLTFDWLFVSENLTWEDFDGLIVRWTPYKAGLLIDGGIFL